MRLFPVIWSNMQDILLVFPVISFDQKLTILFIIVHFDLCHHSSPNTTHFAGFLCLALGCTYKSMFEPFQF